MFGIANYNPHFYSETQNIINDLGPRLTKLIGKNITDVWVVWDNKADEWFEDCPVILNIEEMQLEICTSELDKLSITFNEIDMSKKLDWYGADDLMLQWKKNELSEQILVKNKRINNIQLIECKYTTQKVINKRFPVVVGKRNCFWTLNGISFELEGGYFSIFNGLDVNKISITPEFSDYLRTIKLKV
jgi:hypothetical protein